MRYNDPTGFTWWSHFKGWVGEKASKVFSTTGKLAAWGATFIPSAIDAIDNGWSRLDPFDKGTISNNCFRITNGLNTGSFKKVISRYTWEAPQTLLGFTAPQGENYLGRVKKVDYCLGATVVTDYDKQAFFGFTTAYTLGSFIIGGNKVSLRRTAS